MPKIIGEYVDRLCTVEVRTSKPPRGKSHVLYAGARTAQQAPLTYLAARKIIEVVQPGDSVLLITGSGDFVTLPKGETDGPTGTASLAQALDVGIGAKPIILADARFHDPIAGPCEVLGLTVIGDIAIARRRNHSVFLLDLPVDDRAAKVQAEQILQDYHPKLVIGIERMGPNVKGIYHTVTGVDFTTMLGKSHHIFAMARERGIPTIGIADGGNELGCGLIYDYVREHIPAGAVCRCPCGSGMATTITADVLVTGSISNWAAYGVAAVMAFMLKNPDVLHSIEDERRMVEECVRRGGADGVLGRQIPSVDGVPLDTLHAFVGMLNGIVRNGLRTEGGRHPAFEGIEQDLGVKAAIR